MATIYRITSESDWAGKFADKPQQEFLQTWKYGDFLRRAGREVWRVGVDVPEQHPVQIIVHRRRFGLDSAYIPRATIGREALIHLLSHCKDRGLTFAHLELANAVEEIPFKTVPAKNIQAQHLWILDVRPDFQTLLESMHSKTRYNMRLAERKGVEIRHGIDIDTFFALEQMTTERNRFLSHQKTYYQHLATLENVHQLTAYYAGEPVAVAIHIHEGNKLVYLYGASSNSHRNVMAPYVIQAESIRLAQQLGCSEYDFLGVAPARTPGDGQTSTYHGYTWDVHHEFSGVTRFKAGFGGFVRSYPQAFFAILRPIRHRVHRFFETYIKR